MTGLRIISLYSGSGGNATIVSTRNATVLIDAGKSARSLDAAIRRVGLDVDKIDAIFITHEHTDHISALAVLEKKHPIPVHMTEMSAKRANIQKGSPLDHNTVVHPPRFSVELDGISVSSFCTSHDSAMSVGYRLQIGDISFGVATDTGYVTDDMKNGLLGCDAVLIESNHDEDMLLTGPYPPDLKKRILSRTGHLSNKDCAAFAAELAKSGTKKFALGHLSEENNTPEMAIKTVESALCGFEGISLFVACPDSETVII